MNGRYDLTLIWGNITSVECFYNVGTLHSYIVGTVPMLLLITLMM